MNYGWKIVRGCCSCSRLKHLTVYNAAIRLDEITDDARRMLMNLESLWSKYVLLVRTMPAILISSLFTIATGTWNLTKSIWQLRNWNSKGEEEEGQAVNNIRRLSITGNPTSVQEIEDQYGLIVDCQQLRSLTWTQMTQNGNYMGVQIVQDLQAGLWPFLERLDFGQMNFIQEPWDQMDEDDTGGGRLRRLRTYVFTDRDQRQEAGKRLFNKF